MMVDLAGSERILKSGTIQDDTKASEAKNINTSLTSLGRCITALSKGETFVPYRDSVLTMLLKQSLGGNCYTSVIITAATDEKMRSETLASIQFGKRCVKASKKKKTLGKLTAQSAEINTQTLTQYLKEELVFLNSEIDAMVQTGMNGGINYIDFPVSTQLSFIDNWEKYKQSSQLLEKSLLSIKAGSAKAGKAKLYHEGQKRNLQGILLRSMTTGIWKDPAPKYIKVVQRRIDVVGSLKGLGVCVDKEAVIDIPLTFDSLLRGYSG